MITEIERCFFAIFKGGKDLISFFRKKNNFRRHNFRTEIIWSAFLLYRFLIFKHLIRLAIAGNQYNIKKIVF
jgi:hypothetical protein